MDSGLMVAVIQDAPVFLNLGKSVEKACGLVEQAAGQGAKVAVFPETWLPGYPIWLDTAPNVALWDHPPAKALFRLLVENSLQIGDSHFEALRTAARENEVFLIMGAHERLGGTLYNTMIILGNRGERYLLHRKLMPTYTERMVWGRGDGSTLAAMQTDFGVLGGLICWEHWMPLARAVMHAQQETIHVAQWPAVRELHQIASRHYAFEGQCFVLAAGSVLTRGQMLEGYASLGLMGNDAIQILEAIPGEDDDLVQNGGSSIIGPDGNYVAGPVFGESSLILAELDLGRIVEGQLAIDTSGHYSRPDVFQLHVNDQPQQRVVLGSSSKPE
jgi:predicted amidohydrolase